ncbi:reprolysin-like metallopeptidase [Frateuria hangzhouensis]|uniref:reprolysin-like metallopeptidase n=1 Tax=Frateuria hangzhouensis TaxID=2995589 RepID=UPI002260D064|nr:FG-GAP-like repeat-containing protein [Frateuria sp. STR12]MCX7514044.1 FG-GAP-like repeat-containing protein [Frateuria sp. STR12]
MSRTLMLAMLFASGAVFAAPVVPFNAVGGEASFIRGTDRYYPVQIERSAPQVAAAEGGMWLPEPDGGRVYARTVHVTKQAGGIETWLGKVSVPGGEASVVITMGPDAAFGSLLTADGKPYRLTTRNGKTYLVRKDARATLLRAGGPKAAPPGLDYRVAPHELQASASVPNSLAAQPTANATATSSTVDVLLAYTPGMVTRYGSTSAVNTRLNYLVAVANKAYSDSRLNYRVRLAGTMAVNYSDTGANGQVLDDLVNTSPSGRLASVRARRAALGADLVSVIRPFTSAGQGGFCGLAYLIGENQTPFTTQSAPYGYSTLGDGMDPSTNEYCVDTTLAHEMGHNMGLAHNKADSPNPGAFSYAYGYRRTLATGSFSTIMAYTTAAQEPVPYFANPDITLCNGNRCGDPTTANQTLALNQTMPVVARFATAPDMPRFDLNGDRQADILLRNSTSFTTMLETADFLPDTLTRTAAAGYSIAATGDLDGNGSADLVWTSSARDLFFWMNDGANSYQSLAGPSYAAGWTLVGTGDLNGDGKDDLVWLNSTTRQLMYWLMDGATVASSKTTSVTAGYYVAAIGDFNGDGRADLAWSSPARDLYIWSTSANGSFTSARSLSYPAGWRLMGSGKMNADQRADLVWLDEAGHQFAYWLMNGSKRIGYRIIPVAAGYSIAAIDRYSSAGDGILWTSAARDMYVWRNNGAGGFVSRNIAAYPNGSGGYLQTYPTGWSILSNLPVRP